MPIITISRTLFSGGEQIAEEVAKKMGYPCLRRKELILGDAEDFHFEEAKLVEAMAEPPKLWQRDRDKRDAHFNLIRATFLKRCDKQDLEVCMLAGHVILLFRSVMYRLVHALTLSQNASPATPQPA